MDHVVGVPADEPPVGRQQDENREPPGGEVLLVAKILVGGDDSRETLCLGAPQQITILQRTPTAFEGRDNLVGGEKAAQRHRRALVE